MISTCRVYAPPPPGRRFLVDRLWPRGLSRAELAVEWLPDAAPSAELRRWFGHDPGRWEEFQRRYAAELDARPQSWAPMASAANEGDVVLLYAAADERHNNAVALAAYLNARLGLDPGFPAAACASCGLTVDRAPPTWTLTLGDRGASSWLCGTCTRDNLRALEARLSEHWW